MGIIYSYFYKVHNTSTTSCLERDELFGVSARIESLKKNISQENVLIKYLVWRQVKPLTGSEKFGKWKTKAY